MRIQLTTDIPVIPPGPCCCCGDKATVSESVSGSRTIGGVPVETKAWQFPYCEPCLQHARRGGLGHFVAIGGAIGCTVLGIRGLLFEALLTAGAAGVAFALCDIWRNRKVSHRCACGGPAVKLRTWHGRVNELEFESSAFGRAFLKANGGAAREMES